jgi:hypothetical protein
VQFGADLASVLDDGNKLRVLPIVGRGSVQSVADILFLQGVDRFHLVPVDYARPLQTDYLPATLTSKDYPNLIAEGGQIRKPCSSNSRRGRPSEAQERRLTRRRSARAFSVSIESKRGSSLINP